MHTSQDRRRNVSIFEPSQAFYTPLTMSLKNPRFLCRSNPRYPQLFKAGLNVVEAYDRALDDPRDLTEQTTAQTSFNTHQGLDGQASSIRPGALTPDTPPRSRHREHGWTPGVGIGRCERFS